MAEAATEVVAAGVPGVATDRGTAVEEAEMRSAPSSHATRRSTFRRSRAALSSPSVPRKPTASTVSVDRYTNGSAAGNGRSTCAAGCERRVTGPIVREVTTALRTRRYIDPEARKRRFLGAFVAERFEGDCGAPIAREVGSRRVIWPVAAADTKSTRPTSDLPSPERS